MRGQGLTVIEVLIAITIFAVVLAVIVPLLGLFRLNNQSTRTLNATALAQNVVEDVQGFWRNAEHYNKTCYEPATAPPSQLSMSAFSLDAGGGSPAPLPLRGDCASAPADTAYIPLKRIEVTVTDPSDNTKVLARVTVDIPNPAPPPIN